MQQHSLLQTKLYTPPIRRELVSRPRLIERLNVGLTRKLILVSAPAGFGKTTLVSEWVHKVGAQHAAPLQVAWLSLDEGDNDLARFLTYLIAALRTIQASIGKGVLSALQSLQPPPAEAVLTSLINEIAAYPDRIILVLDDHHTIESSSVDDALAFLLERLPPQMHLVITTREDPHLPLARLRARGQLTEVRASDLRFTSSEAADFLNQAMDLDLSAENVAVLETRTEGWITGLHLAAISMQGRKDVTGFVESFTGSHRFVLDYLIEEVLEQQPESVQAFLLQTSVLTRLTGSLCDTLTGQDNGQATLEMLEHANLFIVPLDNERRWYRYHHLFADLLRQRLHTTQSALVPELHRKASQWCEKNRLIDEAVDHAFAAGDLVRAGYLVEELAEVLWERGEHVKLLGWLNRLSEEQLSAMPQIGIFHSWILHTTGREQAAEKRLQMVERALTSIADGVSPGELNRIIHLDTVQLKSRASVVRARLAFRKGAIPNIIKFSRRALESLPENDLAWRGMAAMALGDSYVVSGDMNPAKEAYSEAIRISEKGDNVYSVLYPSCKLGIILEYLGKLHQAEALYRELMTLVNSSGMSQSVMTGLLYALWSEILCHWNDIDNAFRFASRGVELSEHENDVANLAWIHNALAKVLFARGDLTRAKETILKLGKIAGESNVPPWIASTTAAWRARIWLTEGNLDAAQQWIQERLLNLDDELQFAREAEHIVFARILVAQGDLQDAINLLERLTKKAEAGDRITRRIEMSLVLALALEARGDKDKAMTALERTLTLAEPEGFVRIFVDEGPPMARLLYEALSRGIAPDYIRRLLAAFPMIESEQASPPDAEPPESDLIEPLSERELEVLALIAEGLTNREVASRLFLSLHTVKAHTHNIYGKLGVHNRTQAVGRARALGVLAST
jgi:LuxR family maltose regulon positive regulatory protein